MTHLEVTLTAPNEAVALDVAKALSEENPTVKGEKVLFSTVLSDEEWVKSLKTFTLGRLDTQITFYGYAHGSICKTYDSVFLNGEELYGEENDVTQQFWDSVYGIS